MTRSLTQTDTEHLDWPYFVYGTLRPRCGNSSWWRECGAVDLYDGEVTAPGFRLIVPTTIPYAVESWDEETIVGALVMPSIDEEEQVMLRFYLDTLEGHPSHYRRIRREVITPIGRCMAWIYSPDRCPQGTWVKSGDFYLHREGVTNR